MTRMLPPAKASTAADGKIHLGVDHRLGIAAVLVTLAAFAVIRIQCDDLVWHLATGRLAESTGAWPTTNTFSWTHPAYPLYQQYPLFQALVFWTHKLFGWSGLSILLAVGWSTVFLVLVRWAGSWRRAATMHLPWILALWALQRRFLMRPDLASMLLLGAGLWVAQGYLRGRRWLAVLLPLVQLAWVNSHQLFPLFLLVQVLLMLHVAASRLRVSGVVGAEIGGSSWHALWPLGAAFLASAACTFLTPLGTEIVGLFGHTAGSLSRHREHVQEFAYLWQQPLEFVLALLLGLPAAGVLALSIKRRCWHPFEMGLWLMALLLTLAAVRGLMFFGPLSAAIISRTLHRLPPGASNLVVTAGPRRVLRICALLATVMVAVTAVRYRWITPAVTIGGTQPGVGRTEGDWPDEAMAFLDHATPPGRMMNMPWSAAAVIWFHPEIPVFVDPRFESYPRDFLLAAIASMGDDRTLDNLLQQHHPAWILAHHCRPDVRARLTRLVLHRGWKVVHADPTVAILVGPGEATRDYLNQRASAGRRGAVDDWSDPVTETLQWDAVKDARRACWTKLKTALLPPG